MKTIAMLSQKGGAGKTTLAIHLAVAANAAKRPAVIVDLDAQASATSWKDLRQSETRCVRSGSAIAAGTQDGPRTRSGFGYHRHGPAFRGHGSSRSASSRPYCDPMPPGHLGLEGDLAKLAGKPACILLNAVPPRGALGNEAAAAVSEYGIPVVPVRVAQRAAYMHSLTVGLTASEYEPDGKAAEEIKALYKWISKQVGL